MLETKSETTGREMRETKSETTELGREAIIVRGQIQSARCASACTCASPIDRVVLSVSSALCAAEPGP